MSSVISPHLAQRCREHAFVPVATCFDPDADDAGAVSGKIGSRLRDAWPSSSELQDAPLRSDTWSGEEPTPLIFPLLGIALSLVRSDSVNALAADLPVRSLSCPSEPELIRPLPSSPVTSLEVASWGLSALGFESVWENGITGKDVLIGHLDTGVAEDHPALSGRVRAFADMDFNGAPRSDVTPYDSGYHGTHTAGTICGRSFNGRQLGCAPDALLCSAIVIEQPPTLPRILGGVEWAITHGSRIISGSFGFSGFHRDYYHVADRVKALGALPIFAIGNEGRHHSRSPANYANTLSVGACDQHGQEARFSGSSPDRPGPSGPDVLAPGVNILSCSPDGGTAVLSGTSMAVPHVSGLAALLFHAKPHASVEEVESAIRLTARRNNHGSTVGVIDPTAAVQWILDRI